MSIIMILYAISVNYLTLEQLGRLLQKVVSGQEKGTNIQQPMLSGVLYSS